MRRILTMVAALAAMTASAQFGAPRMNPTVPSVTAEVEDFKPATTNQEGKQYPMVNSQRMVRAQILAPKATFVGLDIAGKISKRVVLRFLFAYFFLVVSFVGTKVL